MPIQPLHNENELLLLLKQGDERAFAEFFYAYHNQLGEFVLLLTDSRELTEEIIQDVFVKVWESRFTLDNVERFTSWLFILTRNYTLNRMRTLVNERRKSKEYGQFIGRTQDLQDCSFNSTENYEVLIKRAIDQLPPQQQKAYLLKLYDELSYTEIAQQMGVSRESVKKYLYWASKSIREFLKANSTFLKIIHLCYFLFK